MKEHQHISRVVLRAHQSGLLDDPTLLELYRLALVALCSECAAEHRVHREELRTGEQVASFSELVRRDVEQNELPVQRAAREGRALLGELLKLPASRRLRAVEKNRSRYNSVHLVALLLEHIRNQFPRDPEAAEELAELVQQLALRLGQEEAGEFRHAALISALALKACSCRVRDRLGQAADYIRLARSIVRKEGVTDNLALAELDLHDGAVCRDRGQYEEAEEKLSRAAFFFLLLQRYEDACRTLLILARLHRIHERFDIALAALDAASAGLASDADELLLLYVDMERAVIKCDQGNYDAATAIIDEHRTQIRRREKLSELFRLAWLEGRIALGRGEHDEAVSKLEHARSLCLRAGNSYDAALISLDIALVHLDRSDMPALKASAQGLAPLLHSEGLHDEATSAVLLFQRALEQASLTPQLVRELARYFNQARNNPHLRFH